MYWEKALRWLLSFRFWAGPWFYGCVSLPYAGNTYSEGLNNNYTWQNYCLLYRSNTATLKWSQFSKIYMLYSRIWILMVDISVGILPEKQNQWGIDRQMYIYIVEFSQVTVKFGWSSLKSAKKASRLGALASPQRIPCFRTAWFSSGAHG